MTLTKNDLEQIRGVVTDVVDFAIEKSELKMGERFDTVDQRFDAVEGRLSSIDREINDLIETNQAFLEKFDDHEKRLVKIESLPQLKEC